MTAPYSSDHWVAQARAVLIEHEIGRRGITLKGNGAERVGPCPKCGGDDRFSINVKEQVWNCRRCKPAKIKGDVIGFVQWIDDADFITACTTLAGEPLPKVNGKEGMAAAPKRVDAIRFDYTDEAGKLLFQVERVEYQNADGSFALGKEGKRRKAFIPRRPFRGHETQHEDRHWIIGLSAGVYLRGRDGNFYVANKKRLERWKNAERIEVDACPRVLYRLPELIESVASKRSILIVEGEAKVDLLRSWDVAATCCAGGANKWRPEHSEYLVGADVVILPDNDIPGRAHLEAVAKSLYKIAASVRFLDLPGLPIAGDIVDWVESGGTFEKLQDLIAGSAKSWTPAHAAQCPTHDWRWHFHGDADVNEQRSWLVQDVIPEIGAGLLSGQWGTYKTFVALDLAGSVMGGKPFINFPVQRRGAVLLFACEGHDEVPIRLAAVVGAKYGPGPAPFAWVDACPRLLDPAAPAMLAAMVKDAAGHMLKEFGLPVALVIIDTTGKAAGYAKAGDENDPVVGQLVMKALAGLAREAKLFVLGVDHFGKNAEVGTRGASSKEADADVVLALLGEKKIGGAVTNPRLAIRKRRTGPNGIEFPFRTQVKNIENGESGKPTTTLIIDWSVTEVGPNAKSEHSRWPKSLRLLHGILMNVTVVHGVEFQPLPDGRSVRAVDIEVVRTEFYKTYPAKGDAKAQQTTRRKAFSRAITKAQNANLIGHRDDDNGTRSLVWLNKIEDGGVQMLSGTGS